MSWMGGFMTDEADVTCEEEMIFFIVRERSIDGKMG